MLLYLRRYHHIHRADWHLLGLCGLQDLHGLSLILHTATKPVYQLANILFLRGKHLKDAVLVLLVHPEECTDALLIGLAGHVWVEVADNLLALVDGIDTSEEHGKEGGTLKVFLTLPLGEDLLVEEVLIESDLVLVHVNHAHAADFKPGRDGRLL